MTMNTSGMEEGRTTQSQYQGGQYREGPLARAMESQSTRMPSDIFLWAAGASILGSLALQTMQQRRGNLFDVPLRRGNLSLFIGQWAPTFLILGLYNKIMKITASDRFSR